MWYHGDWGWGAWLVMTFSMLAFWGLVIWVVAALARGGNGSPVAKRPDPEDVLAHRFAAGEIDADEYQERLAALRSATGRPAGRR